MTGEAFKWVGGVKKNAQPDDFHFAKMFWDLAAKLIADQKVIAHPVKKSFGGLEGVPEGLAQLKRGKASGFKWVFEIGKQPQAFEERGIY